MQSAVHASRPPGVLAHRDFRMLFTAQMLSGLGDGVSLVAVAFAVLQATGSVADLGVVLVARYVPLTALLLVAGVLADRWARRPLLVTSFAVRALAQGSLALLLLSDSTSLWPLLAVQVAYGGAEAFAGPAVTGLLPQVVPRALLQRANALNELTWTMSRTVGPALGGLLVLKLGAPGALAFDATTFVVGAVLLIRVKEPRRRSMSTQAPGFRRELAEGWREVRVRGWILAAVANFTVMASFTIPVVLVLGPALSWRGLGGVAGWSALTSAFGVGALVGSLGGMRLQVRRPGVALMALLVVAALRPLTFLSGLGLPIIAACCFVTGAALSMASIVWFTLLQQHLPPSVLSRVSAIDDLGTSLLTPLGYLGAAPVAAALGLERSIALLAALPVAVGLLSLTVPSLRTLRWAEPERARPLQAAA